VSTSSQISGHLGQKSSTRHKEIVNSLYCRSTDIRIQPHVLWRRVEVNEPARGSFASRVGELTEIRR